MNSVYLDVLGACDDGAVSAADVALVTERSQLQVSRALERLALAGWIDGDLDLTDRGLMAVVEGWPSPLDPGVKRGVGLRGSLL